MTTILLLRHGHTDWIGNALAGRMPGVGLSDHGKAQAAAIPGRLRDHRIDAIYSSPLQRALETASPLAQERGLRIEERAGLTEIDFGEWTGRTLASLEAEQQWRAFNALRGATRIPGGELLLEVQTRMNDELNMLAARHPNGTVALFSHQDTLKAAVAHVLGLPLDLFSRFEIGPASLSVLRLADWGPTLIVLNSPTEV